MLSDDERIRKELILKEEQLLENTIRNDASKIEELIDNNSIEFTASGKQHNYRTGELFGNVDGVLYIDSNTVKMVDLADNCKLLVYVATKVTKNIRVKSNCSSVWKKTNDKWKIVFHQATNSVDEKAPPVVAES